MKIILLNTAASKHHPTLKQFQSWVNAVLREISTPKKTVTINLVDKTTSASLNKTYRQKEYPTNVLSFHYDAMPGIKTNSLGDLVLCVDIVKAEAIAQNKSLESHWAHLTIHGMLHLLGYDHVTDIDAQIMEPLEIKILNALGFEDPYS